MNGRIVDRITAIFTQVVGMAPTRGANTVPDDVEGWDSLAHIRLVHAIEREFGCELPEDLLLVGKPLGDLMTAIAGQTRV